MDTMLTSKIEPRADGRLSYRMKEASAVTGLGMTTLWSLVMSGEIVSFKVGKARLIPADGLRRWMAEQIEAEGRTDLRKSAA